MIRCRIITPTGVYKECDAKLLNVVTTSGQMGILPKHMPIVSMLQVAHMSIDEPEGREVYAVSGGMIYFADDVATLLVQAIENIKDIDVNRATEAMKRAQERIKEHRSDLDIARAEAALKRAINRLNK